MAKLGMVNLYAVYTLLISAMVIDAVHMDNTSLLPACVIGSLISGFWFVRKNKSEKTSDRAMDFVIAILSGLAFGYYVTPSLVGSNIPGFSSLSENAEPAVGILLSLLGAQLVEFIMGGGFMKYVKRRIGDEESDDDNN